MSGQTIEMPRAWGQEKSPMSLRLVTADHHPRMFEDQSDAPPATGVVLGVLCGSMFWIGLAIGWALWG